MSTSNFRIVFMGTPHFAVGILDALLEAKLNVVGVVTVADKPAGRGQKLSESPVKQYATAKNIPILQPVKLKDEVFISELRALQADVFVVVAFRMLPEIVWNMPPKGSINLHASLLPQYRGAAPINWAIMNGETKTGVTTFFIEQEIDTGMVIAREETEIDPNETAGELHDRLLEIGRKLVPKSVIQIENGEVKRQAQATLIGEKELKAAPKIFKEDCQINWNQPAQQVHDFCRGLSPYPTAWTQFTELPKSETKSVKIFKTVLTDEKVVDSGKVLIRKEGVYIPCSDFYLKIEELQPEGKKRISHKEFYAGYQLKEFVIH